MVAFITNPVEAVRHASGIDGPARKACHRYRLFAWNCEDEAGRWLVLECWFTFRWRLQFGGVLQLLQFNLLSSHLLRLWKNWLLNLLNTSRVNHLNLKSEIRFGGQIFYKCKQYTSLRVSAAVKRLTETIEIDAWAGMLVANYLEKDDTYLLYPTFIARNSIVTHWTEVNWWRRKIVKSFGGND